jgi:hypothetical protein
MRLAPGAGQLLLNLLTNAIKCLLRGSTLSFSLSVEADDKTVVAA